MVAQDLISLAKTIETDLQRGFLKDLQPKFQLVGSMAEGTRICLANELDLGLIFHKWKSHTPFRVDGDPFSLKKANTSPPAMEAYFDGGGKFQFHKFVHFILHGVERTISDIFGQGRHPPSIRRITTNQGGNSIAFIEP